MKEIIIDEYVTKQIEKYKKTGACGSVNYSTVQFVPVIVDLLRKIQELERDFGDNIPGVDNKWIRYV